MVIAKCNHHGGNWEKMVELQNILYSLLRLHFGQYFSALFTILVAFYIVFVLFYFCYFVWRKSLCCLFLWHANFSCFPFKSFHFYTHTFHCFVLRCSVFSVVGVAVRFYSPTAIKQFLSALKCVYMWLGPRRPAPPCPAPYTLAGPISPTNSPPSDTTRTFVSVVSVLVVVIRFPFIVGLFFYTFFVFCFASFTRLHKKFINFVLLFVLFVFYLFFVWGSVWGMAIIKWRLFAWLFF